MKNLILLLAFTFIFTGKLRSQYFNDVRSLSMGNTSVAHSYDIDAFNGNPANIINERANSKASAYLNVMTNFKFHVSSKYFSLDFYNKYFTANAVNSPVILTEKDKQDILSRVSNEPVNLNASVKELALVINTAKSGSFGFSVDERFSGEIQVSKDFLELSLFGNVFSRTYNFSDVSLNGTWVRQLNFTYANKINVRNSKLFEEFSYGISLKPQFGLYYLTTEKNDLTIFTDNNFQIHGNGTIELLYSGVSDNNSVQFSLNPSGFGLGFDAGVNTRFRNVSRNGQLNLGISLNDIGYINWYENTFRYFYNGNYVITDITDQEQIDSLKNIIKGTKSPVSSFNTGLPFNLRVGLSYKIFTKPVTDSLKRKSLETISLSMEYIQGFSDEFGATRKPILGIGGEYNISKVVSARLGFMFGGRELFLAGLGVGIDTGPVIIDLGTYNVETLVNPKGTSKIAAGLGIKFKIN